MGALSEERRAVCSGLGVQGVGIAGCLHGSAECHQTRRLGQTPKQKYIISSAA